MCFGVLVNPAGVRGGRVRRSDQPHPPPKHCVRRGGGGCARAQISPDLTPPPLQPTPTQRPSALAVKGANLTDRTPIASQISGPDERNWLSLGGEKGQRQLSGNAEPYVQ